MKTNSLVNQLYARSTLGQPTPTVGMGCTKLGWTDRHAGTIVSVRGLNSKLWDWEIEVVEDVSTVVSGSGHDGSAVYAFTPAANGHRETYRSVRGTGEWRRVILNRDTGRFNQVGGGLRIGERETYYDPTF